MTDEEKDFKVNDRRIRHDEEPPAAGEGVPGEGAPGEGKPTADVTREEKKEARKAYEQAASEAAGKREAPYPQVTFSTFVMSLASSALVALGEVPEPETGQTSVNATLARHTIDILAMLKEKTAPCLDADEQRLLDGLLYELRMQFVMKAK